MAANWWEKFINLFTEEVIEEDSPHRDAHAEAAGQRQRKTVGRIEGAAGGGRQPRVLHRYPSTDDRLRPAKRMKMPEGNEGKPVQTPKGGPRRQATRRAPERRSTAAANETRGIHRKSGAEQTGIRRIAGQDGGEKPRETFGGTNFRAYDVPSPVYGYRTRASLRRDARKASGEETADGGDSAGARQSEKRIRSRARAGVTVDSVERRSDEKLNGWQDVLNDLKDVSPERQTAKGGSAHRLTESRQERTALMRKEETSVGQRSTVREAAGTNYRLPEPHLLAEGFPHTDEDDEWIEEQRRQLAETLNQFHVNAEVTGVTTGPAVTRFEIQPAPGVKVNKIKRLNDDLKLSLAARDIRIEAPIPGKSSVGIEIPNRNRRPVFLREMIENDEFRRSASPLMAALGLDISGRPVVTDLQKMPHGLIGGATGSGKSVCINSLLISLLYKTSPEECKLLLIDPKVVELAPFKDIPHLAAPVIHDPKEASEALKWAVEEMERRYTELAAQGARDIARYNERASADARMPYIVIVIDELADLMMAAPHDVEASICRIAQKARACGIHLVVATQRPSVDVITGLIKANIPTRMAFSVSSQADSRTILDMSGAEKLLGAGDMLFVENGSSQSVRIQGNFVSDDEIDKVTEYVKRQGKPDYLFEKEQLQAQPAGADQEDELFEDACFFVLEQGSASASALQRRFRVGYNRAARLIDMMEAAGMISAANGSKPRDVLMSEDDFLDRMIQKEP
ncbi:MAG TPA: DNA translocase FtsK [Bacillales bacterium]|nr:DNA translocase FtsK [Bacillales bacterium]